MWSGDISESHRIAKNIVKLYKHRATTLKETLNVSTDEMDYWDHATLAEANLLAGFPRKAEKSYKSLFTAEVFKDKPHEIPAKQLKHHLSDDGIESSDLLNQMAIKYS